MVVDLILALALENWIASLLILGAAGFYSFGELSDRSETIAGEVSFGVTAYMFAMVFLFGALCLMFKTVKFIWLIV